MSKRKWLIHEDYDKILSEGEKLVFEDGLEYTIGDEFKPSASICAVKICERSYTTETKGVGKCQVTLSGLSEEEFLEKLESIIKGGSF